MVGEFWARRGAAGMGLRLEGGVGFGECSCESPGSVEEAGALGAGGWECGARLVDRGRGRDRCGGRVGTGGSEGLRDIGVFGRAAGG